MADRKITQLPAAESTDLTNANSLVHVVNPDRVNVDDRNRKATWSQVRDAVAPTTGIVTKTGAGAITGRTITGTTNRVIVSNGNGVSGNPTLSLPQNIHTGATPTFAGATFTGTVTGGKFVPTANTVTGNGMYLPTTNTVAFSTGSVERMRIASNGNVSIANGNLIMSTAGKGIDFTPHPNAPGMNTEVLDDYEEGTWTPAYFGTSGGAASSVSALGRYIKIGRFVAVHFSLRAARNTLSGLLRISGLPFTQSSGNANFSIGGLAIGKASGFASNMVNLRGGSIDSSTQIKLLKGNTTEDPNSIIAQFVSTADMAGGSTNTIEGTFVYRAL
jgi:hypothetical protein